MGSLQFKFSRPGRSSGVESLPIRLPDLNRGNPLAFKEAEVLKPVEEPELSAVSEAFMPATSSYKPFEAVGVSDVEDLKSALQYRQ